MTCPVSASPNEDNSKTVLAVSFIADAFLVRRPARKGRAQALFSSLDLGAASVLRLDHSLPMSNRYGRVAKKARSVTKS